MPSLVILSGRVRLMSRSSNRIRPEVGLYSPVSMLKSVVLPAPFGPMTETIERSGTSSDTSATAVSPPNTLTTFSDPHDRPALLLRQAFRRLGDRAHTDPMPPDDGSLSSVCSAATAPASSSLRRFSGHRPCGRRTITTTSRKP